MKRYEMLEDGTVVSTEAMVWETKPAVAYPRVCDHFGCGRKCDLDFHTRGGEDS